MTEDLYDLLTNVHFQLVKAYDLVPRWLNSGVQVTPDDLNSLRVITTENALLANDLEGDIDALLDDTKTDPVLLALTQVRDAVEMLREKEQFEIKRATLEETLDIVDRIMFLHGYDTSHFRSSSASTGFAAATAQSTCKSLVDVREDRRQASSCAPGVMEQARAEGTVVARTETSRAWNEQSSRREPAKESPLTAKQCSVCGSPTVPSDLGRCDQCFMLEL